MGFMKWEEATMGLDDLFKILRGGHHGGGGHHRRQGHHDDYYKDNHHHDYHRNDPCSPGRNAYSYPIKDYCPGCSVPIQRNFSFCPKCGLNLQPGVQCKSFGASLTAGGTFCPKCGAGVK
ncbi:zinc ribbon domain-containing protein [Desulforamulus aeronauticus]|uniref:double zinc ribbon domain-containing protein n=1 Tax=Desulforamulus aeronauticus TaxID=53343 RepID=UPI0011150206